MLGIPFGSYTLVYTGTSNTLDSRSTPCIALRESNNNGGYYFMSLETGRQIHSNKWVEMPTTQAQIDRVHELVGDRKEVHWVDELINHHENNNVNDKFNTESYGIQEDRSENLGEQALMADELSNNSSHTSVSDQMPSNSSIMSSLSDFPDDPNDSSYKDEEGNNSSESNSIINSEDYTFNINNAFELEHSSIQDVIDNPDAEIVETIGTLILDSTSSISDMDLPITQLMNNGSTAPSTDSSDAESMLTMDSLQLFQIQDSYEKAVHVMFTQMSVHKGIKLFGQKAIAAMMKELK